MQDISFRVSRFLAYDLVYLPDDMVGFVRQCTIFYRVQRYLVMIYYQTAPSGFEPETCALTVRYSTAEL